MKPPSGQDHEDADVSTLAEAYRRAAPVEPTAALDANVLAAARRHVAQREARVLVHRKQHSPWHWLGRPAGAALACAAVVALAIGIHHETADQTGFVNPAGIDDNGRQASAPLPSVALPGVPPVERADDPCTIRPEVPVDVEIQRLADAGCAASVAALRERNQRR